ncbi:MAG: CoA-binding protein [SAR202 cluster bacterium]|nr:CoA-binding protein [SAR202 cluster bacterium]|tara:strand:- start:231 stop:638 length:408 start_codon:yes stop_codon:yes gene_type:complete
MLRHLEILEEARVIAIVGLSDRLDRDSHEVGKYLQSVGYKIVPVNPALTDQMVLGEKCHASLLSVQEQIDIVDIFRRPNAIIPITKDAIKVKAGMIWMQEGIINDEAAVIARDAGLDVVMDMCTMVEHKKIPLKY